MSTFINCRLPTPWRVLAVAAFALAAVGCGSDGAFQDLKDQREDHWKKLGEATMSRSSEEETIKVNDDKSYTKVKLEIRDAKVNLRRFTIVYDNGGEERFDVAGEIKKGDQTRAFDLQGKNRQIRKAVIVGKTGEGADDKARVLLFGWRD